MNDQMETFDPPPETKLAMLLQRVAQMLARQDRLDQSIAEMRGKQCDLTASLAEATQRLQALEG